MADWKQITARIRRARGSKDPAGQLTNLYEKTQDAMVAFELARHFEAAGASADAAQWYITAAGKFRRADWKSKAREAAVRLGAAVSDDVGGDADALDSSEGRNDKTVSSAAISAPESVLPFEHTAAALEPLMAEKFPALSAGSQNSSTSADQDKRGRKRGRRGGRRHRKGATEVTGASERRNSSTVTPRQSLTPPLREELSDAKSSRTMQSRAIPASPAESVGEPSGPSVRGRFGDPGLSSRLSLMEMQFRRLLTCTPVTLEEADRAPAGPGVLVLTDSELSSYYYVEACQTLRIAIANLLRGGSSRRGNDSIKPQLAEHLGIPESRVGKYLAEHCVVRWLQLDEGASHFAHFVISVLRPTLNQ